MKANLCVIFVFCHLVVVIFLAEGKTLLVFNHICRKLFTIGIGNLDEYND